MNEGKIVAFDAGEAFDAVDNADSLAGFGLWILGLGLAGFTGAALVSLRVVLGGRELSTGRGAKKHDTVKLRKNTFRLFLGYSFSNANKIFSFLC